MFEGGDSVRLVLMARFSFREDNEMRDGAPEEVAGPVGREASGNRSLTNFALIVMTACVSLAVFLQWCVLDYYVVRIVPYPDQVHDYDWVCLLFPFLPALALCLWSHWTGRALTWLSLISVSGFGSILSLALITTLGVWIHLLIGGSL